MCWRKSDIFGVLFALVLEMGYGIWGMGYGVWDMGYGDMRYWDIWCLANRLQQLYHSGLISC